MVSVWDHLPTAREILDKRLEAGWRPTPTLLHDGESIEGFAACLFTPVFDRT